MSIRRRYSKEADFADLIHFVEDEATLVNDPLLLKEALSGCVDKRKQLKAYAFSYGIRKKKTTKGIRHNGK